MAPPLQRGEVWRHVAQKRRLFALSNDGTKVWATVLFLSAITPRKVITCQFFFSFLFLKPYLQKQGLWRSRNFVSMVTWRNDFFSLFQSLSSPFQTLLALQTNQYEVQNTMLPLAADWFAPNKVDSPNVTIEWIVTIETKASLKDTVKWTCKEA